MKIWILLLYSTICFSQVGLGETKYTNFTFGTDPYASFKEQGVYVFGHIERVEDFFYVKGGFDLFPSIDGGYFYPNTSLGINLKYGHFDDFRYFAGFKSGFAFRGGHTYTNFGFEGGVNYVFDSGFIIGLKTDYIYRSDFMYWGGDPEYQWSGYINLGFKL